MIMPINVDIVSIFTPFNLAFLFSLQNSLIKWHVDRFYSKCCLTCHVGLQHYGPRVGPVAVSEWVSV